MLHRRIPSPEARLGIRRFSHEIRVSRRDALPFRVLLEGSVVVNVDVALVVTERHVPLRAVRGQRNGLRRRLPCTLRQLGSARHVIQGRVDPRDLRPSLREGGVQRHGLIVKAERAPEGRRMPGLAVPGFLALEESIIGARVLRRLFGKPLLLARPECDTESLRHP